MFKNTETPLEETKRKIFGLLITILVLTSIPLTLILVKQRQEIREKAFGQPGVVEITISPAGTTIPRGSSFPVTVNLRNTASQSKQISIAGVDIQFDPNALEISNVTCGSNFPTAVWNTVSPTVGKVLLTCAKPGGATPFVFASNTTVSLGTFLARVKDTSPFGPTSLTVIRGVIPDAQSDQDLAIRPTNPFNYEIPTPTPTVTPTPTIIWRKGVNAFSMSGFLPSFMSPLCFSYTYRRQQSFWRTRVIEYSLPPSVSLPFVRLYVLCR